MFITPPGNAENVEKLCLNFFGFNPRLSDLRLEREPGTKMAADEVLFDLLHTEIVAQFMEDANQTDRVGVKLCYNTECLSLNS